MRRKDLKKLILEKQLELLEKKIASIDNENRPSLYMGATITRNGPIWTCKLESSENELECVVSYGSCPNQAMLNFDSLWYGISPEDTL